MDDTIGPVTEFNWTRDNKLENEGFTNSKSQVQLFTIAMMGKTPRTMEFDNTKILLSDDRNSNSLLAVYCDKKMNKSETDKLWRKMRIIHGKSKGETEKLVGSLEKVVFPAIS